MLELLRNAHHTVTIDPVLQIARVTRSPLPSESATQFEALWMEVGRALDRVDRHRLCLLIDLRAAAGRNDPQFEAAMQRIRPVVMGGFRRIAILVRTTAGALQIQRHVREDGIDRMIGSDEARLLEYLREAPARSR